MQFPTTLTDMPQFWHIFNAIIINIIFSGATTCYIYIDVLCMYNTILLQIETGLCLILKEHRPNVNPHIKPLPQHRLAYLRNKTNGYPKYYFNILCQEDPLDTALNVL